MPIRPELCSIRSCRRGAVVSTRAREKLVVVRPTRAIVALRRGRNAVQEKVIRGARRRRIIIRRRRKKKKGLPYRDAVLAPNEPQAIRVGAFRTSDASSRARVWVVLPCCALKAGSGTSVALVLAGQARHASGLSRRVGVLADFTRKTSRLKTERVVLSDRARDRSCGACWAVVRLGTKERSKKMSLGSCCGLKTLCGIADNAPMGSRCTKFLPSHSDNCQQGTVAESQVRRHSKTPGQQKESGAERNRGNQMRRG